MRFITDFAFLLLALLFLVFWLVAWAAYHVAGGFVHLLLVIAVISMVVHFFRGRGSNV